MKQSQLKAIQSPALLKSIQAEIIKRIEQEYPFLKAKGMEASINLEELQPTGLKVRVGVILQLMELDEKFS